MSVPPESRLKSSPSVFNKGDLLEMAKAIHDEVESTMQKRFDEWNTRFKNIESETVLRVGDYLKKEYNLLFKKELEEKLPAFVKRFEDQNQSQQKAFDSHIDTMRKTYETGVGQMIELMKSLPTPQVQVDNHTNLDQVKSLVEGRFESLDGQMKSFENGLTDRVERVLDICLGKRMAEITADMEKKIMGLRETYEVGLERLQQFLGSMPVPQITNNVQASEVQPVFNVQPSKVTVQPKFNVPVPTVTNNVQASEVQPVFQLEMPKILSTEKEIIYDEAKNRPDRVRETNTFAE